MTITVGAFKAGTFDGVPSGTTITTSGVTWGSGDVGRCIRVTNGPALGETRKILSQTTNQITIDFAFGTFPILDLDGNDTLSNVPASGNAFSVSTFLDEIDDGIELIKDGDRSFRVNNAGGNGNNTELHILPLGFIYDINCQFRFNANNIDLDGGIRFGDILPTTSASAPYTVFNSCALEDFKADTQGGSGFARGSDLDAGTMQFYGGTWKCSENTTHPIFYRFYDNTGSYDKASHFVDPIITGNFTVRLQGARSCMLNPSVNNLNRFTGFFNGKFPLPVFQGAFVANSTHAVFQNSGITFYTARGLRFDPATLTEALYKCQSGSNTIDAEFIDIVIDDIETLDGNGVPIIDFVTANANGQDHILSNEVKFEVRDSTQALVPDYAFKLTRDSDRNLESNSVSGTGQFSAVKVTYADHNDSGQAQGTATLSEFTIRAPYTADLRKYGKNNYVAPFDAKSTFGVTVPDSDDPNQDTTTYPLVTAQGITGVSIVQHVSPVSWQSLNWGITITGNLTTNPSLTAEEIFHHFKAQVSDTATWGGLAGNLWHWNAVFRDGSNYETRRGLTDDTTLRGVRIVDENGDAFPGVTRMQSDDGTYYVPPVTYTLSFTGLQANTEVRIYDGGTTTELGGTENITGTFNYNHNGSGTIDYVIFNIDYQPIRVTGFALSASNSSIPIQQVFDRNYENP